MEPQPLREFLAWEPVPPRELIGKQVLIEDGCAIIVGRYKTFKSMLTANTALNLAQGYPVLGGLPTVEGGASTLLLQTEISHPILHSRIKPMWASIWTPPAVNGATPQVQGGNIIPPESTTGKQVWFWTEAYIKLDTDIGMVKLAEQIEKLQPQVVIIDPLYKVISGKMTDQDAITRLTDNLDLLRAKYHVAVILVTHTRKPPRDGEEDSGYANSDEMFGSAVFSWWPDTVIQVTRKPNSHPDTITIRIEVSRHAREEIEKVNLRFDRKTLLFKPDIQL